MWLRMLWFHVRMFARVPYFVNTLWTSTLVFLVLMWLASRGTAGGMGSAAGVGDEAWLRAAWVGAWTTSAVAAGLMGFQRFQGTLPHLVLTPSSAPAVLFAPVAAAATFGVLAFPLAAVGGVVMGFEVGVTPTVVASSVTFWVACLAMSAVLASVFVLTPNAITYEVLLAVPVFFASGIVALPEAVPGYVQYAMLAVPTRGAVDAVTGELFAHPAAGLACSVAASALWLWVGAALTRAALQRALVHGSLEVV